MAYSYDIIKRVELIPVLGGDGRFHTVTVPWDDYIPLEAKNELFVSPADEAKGKNIIAKRNKLCIHS